MLAIPLMLLLGCGPEDQTAKARATYTAHVDGCTWIVEIAGRSYAPDRASRDLLSAQPQPLGEFTATYHLTGAPGRVLCGLAGAEVRLPEIVLTAIRVP